MQRVIPFLIGLSLLPMLSSCGESKTEKEARIREEVRLEERARLEEEKIEAEERRIKDAEEARAKAEAAKPKYHFEPGKSYSATYVDEQPTSHETWDRKHEVVFYEDGTFTWTESAKCRQDGRGIPMTYEGRAIAVSRSYHDKLERWYEFEAVAIINGTKRYLYMSVDVDGNVYRGITGRGFDMVPSELEPICKF